MSGPVSGALSEAGRAYRIRAVVPPPRVVALQADRRRFSFLALPSAVTASSQPANVTPVGILGWTEPAPRDGRPRLSAARATGSQATHSGRKEWLAADLQASWLMFGYCDGTPLALPTSLTSWPLRHGGQKRARMASSQDGTHAPHPDVLIEGPDESAVAAVDLQADSATRLALVPHGEEWEPKQLGAGAQRSVPRHEPHVAAVTIEGETSLPRGAASTVTDLKVSPSGFFSRADRCVVVDAPSALTGFLLVMSLSQYRCRNTLGEDGRWRVAIDLGEDSLSDLTEAVERWLQRERIAGTDLRVGAHVQRLGGTEPLSPKRLPRRARW